MLQFYRNYKIARNSLDYTKEESFAYALIKAGMFTHAIALKGNVNMRYELALEGYCHEVLYYDDNPKVRAAVAAHGSYIKELLYDPVKEVRHQAELYIKHYLCPIEDDALAS